MKINEINNLDFGDDEWIYQKNLRLLQELIVVLNHFNKEFHSETLEKKIKYIKKTNSDILSKVFLSPEGSISADLISSLVFNYCIYLFCQKIIINYFY